MRYKAQGFPFGKALSLISHCRKGGGVQKRKGGGRFPSSRKNKKTPSIVGKGYPKLKKSYF
jgi:hypothetical protein